MTRTEELMQDLRPMATTLVDKLRELEVEIERTQADLTELREARTRLTALVRNLNPTLLPEKKKGKATNHLIGDKSYLPFVEWLQANREQINADKGIYANGLLANSTFTVLNSSSVIAKALSRAHEEGLIRIDKLGQGGRKIYKVVA